MGVGAELEEEVEVVEVEVEVLEVEVEAEDEDENKDLGVTAGGVKLVLLADCSRSMSIGDFATFTGVIWGNLGGIALTVRANL